VSGVFTRLSLLLRQVVAIVLYTQKSNAIGDNIEILDSLTVKLFAVSRIVIMGWLWLVGSIKL